MKINLIIKDIMLSKTKNFIYLFLCIVFYTVMRSSVAGNTIIENIITIVINIFMAYYITIIVFHGSNKCGEELFMLAIPYSRREIVISKYSCIIFLDFLFIIFEVAVMFLLYKFNRSGFSISGVILAFMAGIIMISILTPIFIKFNYAKASQLMAILVMAIAFFIAIGSRYIPITLIEQIAGLNISILSFGIMTAIILALSVLLSIKIYSKREFV